MSYADKFKAIAYAARKIPGQYGLRPHTVDLVISQWTGGQTGEGQEFSNPVRLLENGQNPKVRWLRQDELALGGLPKGTAIVGPLTPDFASGASVGGVSIATLSAAAAQTTDTYHVVITGPQHPTGARYRLVSTDAQKALHYSLTVEPVAVESP